MSKANSIGNIIGSTTVNSQSKNYQANDYGSIVKKRDAGSNIYMTSMNKDSKGHPTSTVKYNSIDLTSNISSKKDYNSPKEKPHFFSKKPSSGRDLEKDNRNNDLHAKLNNSSTRKISSRQSNKKEKVDTTKDEEALKNPNVHNKRVLKSSRAHNKS